MWRHIFTYQKILHQLKDFRNQNFSVFWLKKIWTMEMKQNQTFSIGHIQVWHHFSLVARYLHTLMPFIFDIFFQIHCKSEHKQVTWNRTKQYICKSNSIFPYLQSSTLLKWVLKFISWYGLSQKWMTTVGKEKCP